MGDSELAEAVKVVTRAHKTCANPRTLPSGLAGALIGDDLRRRGTCGEGAAALRLPRGSAAGGWSLVADPHPVQG
jgi:hypothetical protein